MATVGSVYAKAVFELASEKGEVEIVSRQLHEFWEAVRGHKGLVIALTGPTVDARARRAILADVVGALGIAGFAGRLLDLLASRGRLAAMPEVLEALQAKIEASQGVLSGKIRSAVELSAEELEVLGGALAKRVGSKVKLSPEVDPALLGGVVATVGGRTFDASLRSQLERFKSERI